MNSSLTDILLQEVAAERSDAFMVELAPGASVCVPASTDIVAHFVLDGEIVVEVDQMAEPLTIGRGEYGLLLYGNRHRIRIAGDQNGVRDHLITEWPIGEEPARLTLGQGRPAAKFISAALRSIYSPVSVRSLHPLPELVHLRHGSQPLFKDTALVTDVAQISSACSGPGATAFVTALMNLHLLHAFRCAHRQIKDALPKVSPTDIKSSPSIRRVAVAVRMLRMHPERQWTVAELARELGQSRSSLAAHFSTHVGIGPMEYLNNVRMEKAAEVLQSRHDLSLCAIARRIGYNNVSSFTRAFKAHFGVPPKAYSTSSSNAGGFAEFPLVATTSTAA